MSTTLYNIHITHIYIYKAFGKGGVEKETLPH